MKINVSWKTCADAKQKTTFFSQRFLTVEVFNCFFLTFSYFVLCPEHGVGLGLGRVKVVLKKRAYTERLKKVGNGFWKRKKRNVYHHFFWNYWFASDVCTSIHNGDMDGFFLFVCLFICLLREGNRDSKYP